MTVITPMLKQYMRFKKKYKDAILLFRMGDFYETFFDDAKVASKVLGLTLTSRNHGRSEDIPLAGIPHHALDKYLGKLIKAGYKVAVCEQVEDPKKAKGIVKRDVVEVISAGTVLSDQLLEAKQNNYLAGIYINKGKLGFSMVDLSTGEFLVTEAPEDRLWAEIEKVKPSEVIVSENFDENIKSEIKTRLPSVVISMVEILAFDRDLAYELLTEHFGVSSLKGLGCDDMDVGVSVAGAVLRYVKENQKKALPHISRLKRYYEGDYMVIDISTQKNLEIISSLQETERENTLVKILDRTATGMGGRLLKKWLLMPLMNVEEINHRLDAVEELVKEWRDREEIMGVLSNIGDLERILAKVCCGRANPRDLVGLKSSLQRVPEIRNLLRNFSSKLISKLKENMVDVSEIVDIIDSSIVDDPPVSVTEGGIIKEGYNFELDDLRKISSDGKSWIARLQMREQKRTGISSLKVKYNRAFGYFIEVTKTNLDKVPPDYMRKQTLVNAERFITPDLKEYEEKVLGADERINELEYEIFSEIRDRVGQHASEIQSIAEAIAVLDLLCSFADIAVSHSYSRPEVSNGDKVEIVDGRHPVVERALPEGTFVPNSTLVDNSSDQILIITGPNMAGKSTYLRQIGLIVLMAQSGSFVPARKANIGVVDRIFTRVGASDSLARGESTFMAEMNEAANILNNATSRSLVILDEVGRGTSTFDGLSIAWAIVEYLHNPSYTRPKTLFATHYHELTELESLLSRVRNYNVSVHEQDGDIIFLRKIVRGGCDQSYGINVAKLAGLPEEVIERANEILANIENERETPRISRRSGSKKRKGEDAQLSLFNIGEVRSHPILDELKEIDINSLTPLEALLKLDELRKKVK